MKLSNKNTEHESLTKTKDKWMSRSAWCSFTNSISFQVSDFRGSGCQIWCFWIDQNEDMTVWRFFLTIFRCRNHRQVTSRHTIWGRQDAKLISQLYSIHPSPSAVSVYAAIIVTSFCSHGHFPLISLWLSCYLLGNCILFWSPLTRHTSETNSSQHLIRWALIHDTLICKRESLGSWRWKPSVRFETASGFAGGEADDRRGAGPESVCFQNLTWSEARTCLLFDFGIWGLTMAAAALCRQLLASNGMSSLIFWLILNLNALLRTNYFVCILFCCAFSTSALRCIIVQQFTINR